MKNVVLVVIDGFGIGEAPDSTQYGDEGSNTYKSISENIKIPNLKKLGLNNIYSIDFAEGVKNPLATYACLEEVSIGKDTTTGHFEIAGLIVNVPFPTFPNGFDSEIIKKLENAFGSKVLGNCVASGTDIINQLGDEHLRTLCPIVYTSADSVLQIACHEEKFGLKKLFKICEAAREIMSGKYAVSRVIARPFLNDFKKFYRTENRKDFAIQPFGETMLDKLNMNGNTVVGVGKIYDIFAGKGVGVKLEAHNNAEVFTQTINAMRDYENALIFANFVDTDMLFGHRNNVDGYRECLERLDIYIGEIIEKLDNNDMIIITADHGCDPSTPSTDHSRERVPLLIFSKNLSENFDLGLIKGFDFISKVVLNYFKK